MPGINLLIKPASSSCNMRCSYCFYQSEAENRRIASYGLMTEETLEKVVGRAFEYADQYCGFNFQGGEPTLAGLAFYDKLMALERKYNTANITVNNSIQTNGVLIDEKWARFMHDNRFLVGLSLDGPKDIHNMHRIDSRREGTFNTVLRAARLLDENKVEFNILSVVTANSARYPDRIYDFYKKNNLHYLQFITCLEPLETERSSYPYALTAKGLENFLKKIFDRWYEDFMRGEYVSIRYFDNLVYMIKGYPPEACNMSGKCQCGCVIESNGNVYPCDFYALDEWKIGNIAGDSIRDMLSSEKALQFEKSSALIGEDCRQCRWYSLCRCGCRRECGIDSETGNRKNFYCEAYRGFLSYAYDRLQHIASIVR